MISFDKILETENIASILDEKDLTAIGYEVVEDYEEDESSRSEWIERNDKWMKLATQVVENKSVCQDE